MQLLGLSKAVIIGTSCILSKKGWVDDKSLLRHRNISRYKQYLRCCTAKVVYISFVLRPIFLSRYHLSIVYSSASLMSNSDALLQMTNNFKTLRHRLQAKLIQESLTALKSFQQLLKHQTLQDGNQKTEEAVKTYHRLAKQQTGHSNLLIRGQLAHWRKNSKILAKSSIWQMLGIRSFKARSNIQMLSKSLWGEVQTFQRYQQAC